MRGKCRSKKRLRQRGDTRSTAAGRGCFGYGQGGSAISEAGMVGWPSEHDGFSPPCRAARAVLYCMLPDAWCLVSVPHGFRAIGRKKWVRGRPLQIVQAVSSRKRFVAARVVVGERGRAASGR